MHDTRESTTRRLIRSGGNPMPVRHDVFLSHAAAGEPSAEGPAREARTPPARRADPAPSDCGGYASDEAPSTIADRMGGRPRPRPGRLADRVRAPDGRDGGRQGVVRELARTHPADRGG